MWCMRYEAKHSFFKQLSNILHNFKNLPKTLASRHQSYMCYEMLESTKYLRHNAQYTGGKNKNKCSNLNSKCHSFSFLSFNQQLRV